MMSRFLITDFMLAFMFVLVAFGERSFSWLHQPIKRNGRGSALFASVEAPPFPRAAVSVAVRCSLEDQVYYLLVQRANPPNTGQWSFPGGKLELGETALEGGRRELLEETRFPHQDDLIWYKGTISTADSILPDEDGSTQFHFLIAICFAELKSVTSLPKVTAADDAKDARWWTMDEIRNSSESFTSPGLFRHMERAEILYENRVL